MTTTATPTTTTSTTDNPATDEARIRELLAAGAAGMRDRDAARMLAAYAADVVQYTLAPPLQHLGADVEAVQSWISGFDGPIEQETVDLRVHVGGDIAFAYGLMALRATPAGSPEGFELWLRTTVGLARAGGDWRIVHAHQSVPFHMEMQPDGWFRAATDLQP